jgi:hypothetical protein
MVKFRLPTTVGFHLPSLLSWSNDMRYFELIKEDINLYYNGSADLNKLMKVVDDIEMIKAMGDTESLKIMSHIVSYLRMKLLFTDIRIIEMTAVLLDVLVKNCQYWIHIYVGRKVFMKTFCLVTRTCLADAREKYRCVGELSTFPGRKITLTLALDSVLCLILSYILINHHHLASEPLFIC